MRRFCNTTNLESGADLLAESGGFDNWLVEQGAPPLRLVPDDLARVVRARELLRSAAVAHRDRASDRESLDWLSDALGSVTFRFAAAARPLPLAVDAADAPAERFLGSIALAVAESMGDGTWGRLKACARCRWVFFDSSKNRSGRWCSMAVCGGRTKVHNHRVRQRGGTANASRAIA